MIYNERDCFKNSQYNTKCITVFCKIKSFWEVLYILFTILDKVLLNKTVVKMKVFAPYVAHNVKPGQFIILRANKEGERIPLTVFDYNRKEGTITIIFQIVGATTKLLNELKQGEKISDIVGPLGKPSELNGLKKVAVIGGGVGCAISYPLTKHLYEKGTIVHSIVGFRNKELVILEEEFKKISNKFILTTDDGTYGKKGLVTNSLEDLIKSGEKYDKVIAIGPLIMMKLICKITKKYYIKTTVSMNPIMIDGTGMCGGCRVSVGGKTKFACVEGPDFDGHLIDFDETMKRNVIYKRLEEKAYEKTCNLLKGVN